MSAFIHFAIIHDKKTATKTTKTTQFYNGNKNYHSHYGNWTVYYLSNLLFNGISHGFFGTKSIEFFIWWAELEGFAIDAAINNFTRAMAF